MVTIKVVQEGQGFTVQVENEAQGYRRSFGEYIPKKGQFGTSPAEYQAAKTKAEAEAQDWAVRFLSAGIKAEVVS